MLPGLDLRPVHAYDRGMSPSPRFLTERQKEILEYIQEFQLRRGLTPTHREICEQFGYSSYGTVHKHLKLLREKGYLRRTWNQKRGIEVVERRSGRPARELPYFGIIAAGRPIEAVAGDERMEVPPHLVAGSRREHFVLKVVGESMIDEGIFDGDLVVVESREEAASGEMVVALVDGESTLKRFYPEGETVRLQPANPTMEPLLLPARDVAIQGIVVGLMRRF